MFDLQTSAGIQAAIAALGVKPRSKISKARLLEQLDSIPKSRILLARIERDALHRQPVLLIAQDGFKNRWHRRHRIHTTRGGRGEPARQYTTTIRKRWRLSATNVPATRAAIARALADLA